jgi:hypothetical protein
VIFLGAKTIAIVIHAMARIQAWIEEETYPRDVCASRCLAFNPWGRYEQGTASPMADASVRSDEQTSFLQEKIHDEMQGKSTYPHDPNRFSFRIDPKQ